MRKYATFELGGTKAYVGMHKDEGGYFCGIYINRPTPSGLDRFYLQASDKRRFPTMEEADAAFAKGLRPEVAARRFVNESAS